MRFPQVVKVGKRAALDQSDHIANGPARVPAQVHPGLDAQRPDERPFRCGQREQALVGQHGYRMFWSRILVLTVVVLWTRTTRPMARA